MLSNLWEYLIVLNLGSSWLILWKFLWFGSWEDKFHISDISRLDRSYVLFDFGMYMVSGIYSSVKVEFLALIAASNRYMQRLV